MRSKHVLSCNSPLKTIWNYFPACLNRFWMFKGHFTDLYQNPIVHGIGDCSQNTAFDKCQGEHKSYRLRPWIVITLFLFTAWFPQCPSWILLGKRLLLCLACDISSIWGWIQVNTEDFQCYFLIFLVNATVFKALLDSSSHLTLLANSWGAQGAGVIISALEKRTVKGKGGVPVTSAWGGVGVHLLTKCSAQGPLTGQKLAE